MDYYLWFKTSSGWQSHSCANNLIWKKTLNGLLHTRTHILKQRQAVRGKRPLNERTTLYFQCLPAYIPSRRGYLQSAGWTIKCLKGTTINWPDFIIMKIPRDINDVRLLELKRSCLNFESFPYLMQWFPRAVHNDGRIECTIMRR